MKLKPLGEHKAEVTINGTKVLFSYETPVAADVGGMLYRTEQFHSVTTSRHINQWLDGRPAEKKPQAFFNQLAE